MRRMLLLDKLDQGDFEGAKIVAKHMESVAADEQEEKVTKIIISHYKQVPKRIILELTGLDPRTLSAIISKRQIDKSTFYYYEGMYGTANQFGEYWGMSKHSAYVRLSKKAQKVTREFRTTQDLYNNTNLRSRKFRQGEVVAIKYGVEVARGTKQEVAEKLGLSLNTIITYMIPSYLKRATEKSLKIFRAEEVEE